MFYRGSGSVIAFHRPEDVQRTCAISRLKAPAGDLYSAVVLWDNQTGREYGITLHAQPSLQEMVQRLGSATIYELFQAATGAGADTRPNKSSPSAGS